MSELEGRRMAVLGDINLDIIAFHGNYPVEGAEDLAERAYMRHGGSGANIAHALSVLGGNVVMIGCVGDDPVGEMLVDGLAEAGVDTAAVQKTASEPTGIVYIVVSRSGERTMLAYRGANKCLKIEDVYGLLRDVSVVHVSGYSLLEGSQRDTAMKVLEWCRCNRAVTTLDFCIPLASRNAEFLDKVVEGLSCVFINLQELMSLSGRNGLCSAEELASRWATTVVLKKGRAGAEIVTPDGATIALQAVNMDIVDTTGAGDAFAAGFIYELARGASLRECGERAVNLGGRVSTSVGGRLRL
jgi:ribokinase